MDYKVLVSFGGKVNGTAGQQITINDKAIADDLLKAGYIVSLEKPEKKATRKKVKAEE